MIHRSWCMPNSETFLMPPVEALLARVLNGCAVIVDPFARNSQWGTHRNDLNPETAAHFHMEAREFLALMESNGIVADAVLFDPPYSPRQIAECYQQVGRGTGMTDTQSAVLYRDCRKIIDRILKPGGITISFGWNSTGMGKQYETLETHLLCHGGAHNDTIIVVQQKPPEVQGCMFATAPTEARDENQ